MEASSRRQARFLPKAPTQNWPRDSRGTPNGPFVLPPVDIWVHTRRQWSDIDRENRRTRRKSCPAATFFSPQILHGLSWVQTPASAVCSQRINAWAVERPVSPLVHTISKTHFHALKTCGYDSGLVQVIEKSRNSSLTLVLFVKE